MAKKSVKPKVIKKVKTPVSSRTVSKMPTKVAKPKTKAGKRTNNQLTIAIVALVLNIIILPGLGSLIGGKTKTGIWQIVLFIAGIPLVLILIGIPIMIAAWIWGIVTGIKLIQEAQ